jgi:hypothetical protein
MCDFGLALRRAELAATSSLSRASLIIARGTKGFGSLHGSTAVKMQEKTVARDERSVIATTHCLL